MLLAMTTLVASSAAFAQTISVDQPPMPLATHAPNAAPGMTTEVPMRKALSLNWARVTAGRDANGKLVAQCTVEPEPAFAAARKRAGITTTQRKK